MYAANHIQVVLVVHVVYQIPWKRKEKKNSFFFSILCGGTILLSLERIWWTRPSLATRVPAKKNKKQKKTQDE